MIKRFIIICFSLQLLMLGTGNKLFDDDTILAAFTLLESTATASGVIAAHYKGQLPIINGS